MLLAGAGLSHFIAPEGFERIVPPPLGAARFWVFASGVAEMTCAALIAAPRTRRRGATLAALLFVAVFPANVYAAVQGGYGGLPRPLDSPVTGWLRLPLQLLLIRWAFGVRDAATRSETVGPVL